MKLTGLGGAPECLVATDETGDTIVNFSPEISILPIYFKGHLLYHIKSERCIKYSSFLNFGLR